MWTTYQKHYTKMLLLSLLHWISKIILRRRNCPVDNNLHKGIHRESLANAVILIHKGKWLLFLHKRGWIFHRQGTLTCFSLFHKIWVTRQVFLRFILHFLFFTFLFFKILLIDELNILKMSFEHSRKDEGNDLANQ